MTTNPTAPQDGGEKLALINEIISMYHTTRLSGVPAAAHILSKPTVQKAFEAARNEALEEAAAAARDAMVVHEWPPQDGDVQIDEVLAAIRALQQKGPSNG